MRDCPVVGFAAGCVFLLGALTVRPVSAQPAGACTTPGTERTREVGCYFTASEALGALGPGSGVLASVSVPESCRGGRRQRRAWHRRRIVWEGVALRDRGERLAA